MSRIHFRLSTRAAAGQHRCALLERLIARADGSSPIDDWRAAAFRVLAPHSAALPAVAAVAQLAQCGAADGAWVCIATPVHYLAEMSNVRLPADGILSLDPAEALALAGEFNREWQDLGLRLAMGRRDLFFAADRELDVSTHDPEEVLGRHIEAFLPAGTDAPRLLQLMSEIEMWLFDHALNKQRIARGLAPVSGLWPWGGGRPVPLLPEVHGWTAGNDLCFGALNARDEFPAEPGAAVIVLAEEPGTDAWRRAESRWLEPALAQLRSRRTASLEISSAHRCFAVSARSLRRFWRPLRPWWESFA